MARPRNRCSWGCDRRVVAEGLCRHHLKIFNEIFEHRPPPPPIGGPLYRIPAGWRPDL